MRSDGIRRTTMHDPAHPDGAGQEHDPKREDLPGLRAAWRRQSLSAGWLAEDDWWTTAVDAVARAACRDGSLRQACALLGRARAQAGVGISEAMTDVAALYRVLGEGTPTLDVITALAEGWADAGLARLSGATCEDPLTGLVSFAYLRTRLREVYRDAEQQGTCPRPRTGWSWWNCPGGPTRGGGSRWSSSSATTCGRRSPAATRCHWTAQDRRSPWSRSPRELAFRFTSLRRTVRAALGTEVRMIRLRARPEDAERLLDELAH